MCEHLVMVGLKVVAVSLTLALWVPGAICAGVQWLVEPDPRWDDGG